MKENNLKKMQLSNKVNDIPEALSIYINQLVYSQKRHGIDVITLSLGEAFFDIPLMEFSKLNVEKGYHYSDSKGIPALREKIADYYNKKYDSFIDYEKEILISAGSKSLIYMAIQAVINDNDEVLIHEPAWLSYQEHVKLVGGIPKFISYDTEIDDIHYLFSNKTRMLIINNPNNPAGFEYSKEQLISIYEQCRKNGIYVLVDEAYSDFVPKGKFYSMASIVKNKDGIIVVNSLSKNLGISGWRIGYVIAQEQVIHNVLKLNQHLITCAPTILLLYLERYFDDIINITLPQVNELIIKREEVKKYLKKKKIDFLKGGSTFYFFLNIGCFEGTSLEFALYLLFKYGISVVPGSAYGKSTNRFIRVAIGTESLERIFYAIDIIHEMILVGKCDRKFVDNKLVQFDYRKFMEKKNDNN